MMDITTLKYLIIEDEEENRDILLRILINEYGVFDENIEETEDLRSAKEAVDDFEPNIVFLDLKIPYDSGYEPEMQNAYDFIEKVKLYNHERNDAKDKIKIIVISGSIKDKGVQKLITMNRPVVMDFFDKGEIAGNLQRFTKNFKKKIEKAINFDSYEESIDYSFVRKSSLKELQKINNELWLKLENQVLNEFEKLNNKKVNEFNISKQIIINCGEIVEDILHYFNYDTESNRGITYSHNDNTVQRKLTKVSGRDYIGRDEDTKEPIFESKNNELIRRTSQEYALMAYRMSSQARHSKEGDDNNSKWFAGFNSGFTKEDAAIAINLVVPLIQDYVNYMKSK